MGFQRIMSLAALSMPLLLLSGCATHVISPKYRQMAQPDLTFSRVQANPLRYKGATVIWGGKIIDTIPTKKGTKMIVLQIPLGDGERPDAAIRSQGRFIAVSDRFLDPAIYSNERRITLAGEIIGQEVEALGETEYTYPVVEVGELYLWNEYRDYPRYYYPYYPYYWGPYPGFRWGLGFYGYP